MEEVTEGILKAVFDKVNSEDTFARLIGMKLIELQPGFARTTLPVTDATINIYQMAHGKREGTLANLETSFRPQQS
jgi:acyl-coenzyme A thioesterase PaaI-like protein